MIIRAVIEWDEEEQSYSATCPELNVVVGWVSLRSTQSYKISDRTI
jgi:hypothetical protein